MSIKTILFFGFSSSLIILFSCGDNQATPKPPTYLRMNFPDSKAYLYKDECLYNMMLAKYMVPKKAVGGEQGACHRDIEMKEIGAICHFSFINMTEPLSKYLDYAIDKIDEHKIKATAIEDTLFINRKTNVFGALYELQGNVATNYQFYLTDSTKRFVSGVIYFNCSPNYDSLKPTLQYLRKDLIQLMSTFKWN